MLKKSASYYEEPEMTEHITTASLARTGRLRFCLSPEIADKRILDLGCGPGTQISYLAGKNTVVGADAGFTMLQNARQEKLLPCRADFEQPFLPFQDDCFDIIVCTDVIEHVRYPMHLLQEIRRVLNSQGIAILSVPNQFHLLSRLRMLFGKNILAPWDHKEFKAWDYFHLHFWTWRDFQDFLQTGGFEVRQAFPEEVPMDGLHIVRLLLSKEYLENWNQRHAGQKLYRWLVKSISVFLRWSGIGRFLTYTLPRFLPALFTQSHLVSVNKKAH